MSRQRRTVAVVDDDPAVLRSIARLLANDGYLPATYGSPTELLEQLDELDPYCIVADLAMPDLTGLELQRRLTARNAELPIVFITGHGDIRSSVAAMRGGAVDFMQKPFAPVELLDAVKRACDRAEEARRASAQRSAGARRFASLTRRERQVFELMIAGKLNKQIAAELRISEKTVKVHRARVMRKLDVRSAVLLARLAIRSGYEPK